MKFMLSVCCLTASIALFGQQSEFGSHIGTWQETKYSFEIWRDEDSFLSATAYQVDSQSGKRIVGEEIKLVKKRNDFLYIPDIAGPQGQVGFKIISFDKSSFIAENPRHDFPKRITYKRTGEVPDAIVSGDDKSRHVKKN